VVVGIVPYVDDRLGARLSFGESHAGRGGFRSGRVLRSRLAEVGALVGFVYRRRRRVFEVMTRDLGVGFAGHVRIGGRAAGRDPILGGFPVRRRVGTLRYLGRTVVADHHELV
jgi:hypothetical protein